MSAALETPRDAFAAEAYLSSLDCSLTMLGRTIGDRPIWCARVGGEEGPPIVIASGSHATEPAGIIAAFRLIKELRTNRPVYIVPLRDPLGWEGYAACLKVATGRDVVLRSHADVEEILVESGDVIHRDGDFIIAVIGSYAFATMRQPEDTRGPQDIWKRITALLKSQPELIPLISGRRLFLPENLAGIEGCGAFDHAFTAVVMENGAVANFNRMLDLENAPTEVRVVRKLIDSVRSPFAMDLHEGQGTGFHLFSPPLTEERRAIARRIVTAVGDLGVTLLTLDHLRPIIGEGHAAMFADEGGGILIGTNEVSGQGQSFTSYATRHGYSVTTESGRWAPLQSRVEQQLAAVGAAVAKA